MENSTPPSALQSVLACQCPRCRKGKLFTHAAYDIANFQKMNEHCPYCGLKFEPETGFFWGAMYITYAFSAGLFLVALVPFMIFRPPFIYYLVGLFSMIIGLTPLMIRYSRIIMLHLFTPYRFRKDMWEGKNLGNPKWEPLADYNK